MRHHNLQASVCRDIVRELIQDYGPMSVSRIYLRIRKVFRVNSAYLVTTLTAQGEGFVIDNGIVYESKPKRRKR